MNRLSAAHTLADPPRAAKNPNSRIRKPTRVLAGNCVRTAHSMQHGTGQVQPTPCAVLGNVVLLQLGFAFTRTHPRTDSQSLTQKRKISKKRVMHGLSDSIAGCESSCDA